MHAEVKHTNPLAQHYTPLVAADHPATPYKELFPDSKIVQNFKRSPTKTTCTLNQAARPLQRNELTELYIHKSYAMRVITAANSGKAENLLPAIDSTVKNDGANWNNLDSIGLDNTNSNMGIRSSIKSRILKKSHTYLWPAVTAI